MKFFEITSEKDQEDYETYKKVRGVWLYEFIAEYCCQELNLPIVNYQLVRDIIIYDKRLKDILYIFLGTYEDYLKAEISLKTYFDSCKNTFCALKEKQKNDISSFNEINSKIYNLNEIKKVLNKTNLLNDYPNLDKIRKFRNKVMHFNFLLFRTENNGFVSCLVELKENIEFLKISLPNSYQRSFLDKINNTKKGLSKNTNHQINKFLMEDF